MQARLIAYPPDQAAIGRPLAPGSVLRVGRGGDCGMAIEHPSISRAHAELLGLDGGWRLRDLGSKNGSFVDGARIEEAVLGQPCWLRRGDVYCEFDLLDDARVAALETGIRARRHRSTANPPSMIAGHTR